MEAYVAQFWSLIGLFTVLRNLLPRQVVDFLTSLLHSWFDRENSFSVSKVPQYRDGKHLKRNALYEKVKVYLGTLNGLLDTENAELYTTDDEDKDSAEVAVRLGKGASVEEEFMGVKVRWSREKAKKGDEHEGQGRPRSQSYLLKIPRNEKRRILRHYLKHVQSIAKGIQAKRRQLRLFTNGSRSWSSLPFNHPATFESMAFDSDVKERIIRDLDAFVQDKPYFHKLGRPWKRGYLFHGPPGTGKSSMVAAMANYLRFDVYDLELTKVWDNSHLRSLLTSTGSKSILIIEDIDCTAIDFSRRKGLLDKAETKPNKISDKDRPENVCPSSGITLSGMLNVIDGLWSCYGEERIIVFTTNTKEKLDPALLRPGRMDLHVYFPPCSFTAFKMLARNYLGLEKHETFALVEVAFAGAGVVITPAEIGEILLSNKSSPELALKAVAALLQSKRR